MATNWYNADGLNVKIHGDYDRESKLRVNRARATVTAGFYQQLAMDIDLVKAGASATYFPTDRNNDGTNEGFTTEEAYLPAGACVTSAIFVTSEVAAGGTSFAVGTYQVDGTTIDDDSIVTDTEAVLASMDHIGDKIVAAGAYTSVTSGTSGPALNAYLAVKTTGTFTAGKGTLIINYIMPE